MTFRPNESENPDINYAHIPVSALQELRLLVEDLKGRLSDINGPISLYHGDKDPVVDPTSATMIQEKIGADKVKLTWIESDRHGILIENRGGCRDQVVEEIHEITQRLAQMSAQTPETAAGHLQKHTPRNPISRWLGSAQNWAQKTIKSLLPQQQSHPAKNRKDRALSLGDILSGRD